MKNISDILSQVAKEYNVSVSEVRRSIEQMARDGLSSEDINLRYLFSQIPCKGDEPTAEEIVMHFAVIIARTKGLM